MSHRFLLAISLVLCAGALAACGGGGSDHLSANDYRARLAAFAKQENQAQARVQTGLRATTVSGLTAAMSRFADDQEAVGKQVAALKAPKDAEAANAELARGLTDTADEVRVLVSRISGLPNVKAAAAVIQKAQPHGGQELDQALTELRKKGYTKGS